VRCPLALSQQQTENRDIVNSLALQVSSFSCRLCCRSNNRQGALIVGHNDSRVNVLRLRLSSDIGRTVTHLTLLNHGVTHAVHGVGETLCTLGAVRVVGVHAAEVETIPAGAVFYVHYVCCHNVHLRSKLHRVVS
jgi:hypothetical protein